MKKRSLFLSLLTVILVMSACSGKEKEETVEIDSEASFYGKVIEVNEENLLVNVYDDNKEPIENKNLYVSREVQLEESDHDFNPGDEVTVHYNGVVAISYPGQVTYVYAIILQKPAAEN